jgi:polyferredoxin
MAKRNEPGLIRYTFGLHGEGAIKLLNPRVLLPAVAILALLAILFVALLDRPAASLKVAVSHTAQARQLPDSRTGTFFNAWINNRSQEAETYILLAREKETGIALSIKGQVSAELKGGENRRLDFVLVTPADKIITVEFVLTGKEGLELSVAEAYIGKTGKE